MAKKQRRKQQVHPVDTRPSPLASSSVARQPSVQSEARAVVSQSSSPARPKSGATWEELQGRYSHVNGELKQIGTLAGSFLVVLLILAAILS